MLKEQSLIYFAPEPWDGLWRNRQQLMSRFAKHNKVLFVEPAFHLRSAVAGFRRGDLPLQQPQLTHLDEGLHLFRYPNFAPISGRSPLHEITRFVRQQALKRAMAQLDMRNPIVWFSRPSMVTLLPEMPKPRLLIYHVVDEYSAYAGQDDNARKLTQAAETEMLALADLVVVVSENLYQSKKPHNDHTYLVANGVNYQAYQAALANPRLPDCFQNIPSPRLGYSGLVGDRLNLAMLQQVAQAHPEWAFVFLGEARFAEQGAIWENLKKLENVYYLGQVDVAEVPHYLNAFDVGLMPYAQTPESANISPLKLYDYLATGLPVASIDIPAARVFVDYIHLAKTPETFGQAIQNALNDRSETARHTRRAIAKQHTWDARVTQLSDIINRHLTM